MFSPFQNTPKFLISGIKSKFWILSYLCMPRHCALSYDTNRIYVCIKITNLHRFQSIYRNLLVRNLRVLTRLKLTWCYKGSALFPAVQFNTACHVDQSKTSVCLVEQPIRFLPVGNNIQHWELSLNSLAPYTVQSRNRIGRTLIYKFPRF